jgi:3',5'-cyclic AMP phosphodiesterase CpdA
MKNARVPAFLVSLTLLLLSTTANAQVDLDELVPPPIADEAPEEPATVQDSSADRMAVPPNPADLVPPPEPPEEPSGVPADEESEVESLPFVPGSFTIAVLPDTQGYSEHRPWIFDAQTAWIAENADKRNIEFVLHLGDVVEWNSRTEWGNAQRAMSRLDGVVPFAIALGNHDMGTGGSTDNRSTHFNNFFPLSRYQNLKTFGGVFDREPDRLDNSFHLFSAAGRDFVVLALEFGPRDEVVEWAGRVLSRYPDRLGILVTHSYMYHDETRYDWRSKGKEQNWSPYGYGVANLPGGVNDGEDLWRKLVSKHANLTMVFSGHVVEDGVALLSSKGKHGNTVHQMLVNFQMTHRNGDGFLRFVEFLPDGETVQVKDYSPLFDRYLTGPQHQFTLKVPQRHRMPEEIEWDFEDTEIGSLPHRWRQDETLGRMTPAEWGVARMNGAPSGDRVLLQTDSVNYGRVGNLVVCKDTHYNDLEMAVRLKALGGSEEPGGGVVWGYRGSTHYYVARWDALAGRVSVEVQDGRHLREIASASVRADPTRWHEIEVDVEGDEIEVEFEGDEAIDIEDSSITSGGAIGLWTKADAATAFDDMRVESE